MLNEEQLKTLLEVAEHVAGPFQSALHEATWREEFRQQFTPTTCAELAREVMRLRGENDRIDKMLLAICEDKGKQP